MTSPSVPFLPRRLPTPMAVVSALAVATACGCTDGSDPTVGAAGSDELFGLSEAGEWDPREPAGDDTLDELLLVGDDAPRFGLVRTPMSHWAQQEYVRRDALVHEDGSSTEFVIDPEDCAAFDQSLWQSGVDTDNSALSGALVDEMLLTVLITSATDRYGDLDELLADECEEVEMRPVTRTADGELVSDGMKPGPDGHDYVNGTPFGTTSFRNVALDMEAPAGVDEFVAVLQFQDSTDESVNGAENVYIRGVVDGIAVDVSVSSVFGGSVDEITSAAELLFEEQVDKISELH